MLQNVAYTFQDAGNTVLDRIGWVIRSYVKFNGSVKVILKDLITDIIYTSIIPTFKNLNLVAVPIL